MRTKNPNRTRRNQPSPTAPPGTLPPPGGSGRIKAFRIGLTGALGVGIAVMVLGAVSSLTTLLVYVGLALFVALGMDPVIRMLQRRGLPRPVAVAAVFAGVLGAVAAVLYWIIPVLIRESTDLIRTVPRVITAAMNSEWFQMVESLLVDFIDLGEVAGLISTFLSDPQNLIAVGGGVLALGAGIMGGVSGAIIVSILSLYFALSLGRVKNALYQLVAASRREAFVDVAEDIAASVSRYILGQFALSLINGVLSAFFLSMIGAPTPLLLALVAFIGSTIPLVGTIASSVIITAVCLTASPSTAVAAGIYYLIYMQVEAYILTPRIMDKMVEVPGSLVVIAVVAGSTLGGIIGALVAVPIAASAVVIMRKVVIPRQNRL